MSISLDAIAAKTAEWVQRLVCYVQAKNIDDAFSSCNEVLAEEPDNIDALCDRAETYINNEQYEEGTTLHSDSISYSHAIFHLSLNC